MSAFTPIPSALPPTSDVCSKGRNGPFVTQSRLSPDANRNEVLVGERYAEIRAKTICPIFECRFQLRPSLVVQRMRGCSNGAKAILVDAPCLCRAGEAVRPNRWSAGSNAPSQSPPRRVASPERSVDEQFAPPSNDGSGGVSGD